jgi:hypothetical protein
MPMIFLGHAAYFNPARSEVFTMGSGNRFALPALLTLALGVMLCLLSPSIVAQNAGDSAQPKLTDPVTITVGQWLEARVTQELLTLPYPYRASVSILPGPVVKVTFTSNTLAEVPDDALGAYRDAVVAVAKRCGFAGFRPSNVVFAAQAAAQDRVALMSQPYVPTRRAWAGMALNAALAAAIAAEGRRMTGTVLPDGRVAITMYDIPQSTSGLMMARVADRVNAALAPVVPGFSAADISISTAVTPVVTPSQGYQ